jgi:hypothetical protein
VKPFELFSSIVYLGMHIVLIAVWRVLLPCAASSQGRWFGPERSIASDGHLIKLFFELLHLLAVRFPSSAAAVEASLVQVKDKVFWVGQRLDHENGDRLYEGEMDRRGA